MSLDTTLREAVRAEMRAALPDLLAELTSLGDDTEFVDTAGAARLTGLSVAFFQCGRTSPHSEDRAAQPPHYKIGRRVLYRRRELLEWVNARREAMAI